MEKNLKPELWKRSVKDIFKKRMTKYIIERIKIYMKIKIYFDRRREN